MKLKKGTDVVEFFLEGSGEAFLVRTKGKYGKALIKALESVVGSPALEAQAEDKIVISRYKLDKDVRLVEG